MHSFTMFDAGGNVLAWAQAQAAPASLRKLRGQLLGACAELAAARGKTPPPPAAGGMLQAGSGFIICIIKPISSAFLASWRWARLRFPVQNPDSNLKTSPKKLSPPATVAACRRLC